MDENRKSDEPTLVNAFPFSWDLLKLTESAPRYLNSLALSGNIDALLLVFKALKRAGITAKHLEKQVNHDLTTYGINISEVRVGNASMTKAAFDKMTQANKQIALIAQLITLFENMTEDTYNSQAVKERQKLEMMAEILRKIKIKPLPGLKRSVKKPRGTKLKRSVTKAKARKRTMSREDGEGRTGGGGEMGSMGNGHSHNGDGDGDGDGVGNGDGNGDDDDDVTDFDEEEEEGGRVRARSETKLPINYKKKIRKTITQLESRLARASPISVCKARQLRNRGRVSPFNVQVAKFNLASLRSTGEGYSLIPLDQRVDMITVIKERLLLSYDEADFLNKNEKYDALVTEISAIRRASTKITGKPTYAKLEKRISQLKENMLLYLESLSHEILASVRDKTLLHPMFQYPPGHGLEWVKGSLPDKDDVVRSQLPPPTSHYFTKSEPGYSELVVGGGGSANSGSESQIQPGVTANPVYTITDSDFEDGGESSVEGERELMGAYSKLRRSLEPIPVLGMFTSTARSAIRVAAETATSEFGFKTIWDVLQNPVRTEVFLILVDHFMETETKRRKHETVFAQKTSSTAIKKLREIYDRIVKERPDSTAKKHEDPYVGVLVKGSGYSSKQILRHVRSLKPIHVLMQSIMADDTKEEDGGEERTVHDVIRSIMGTRRRIRGEY